MFPFSFSFFFFLEIGNMFHMYLNSDQHKGRADQQLQNIRDSHIQKTYRNSMTSSMWSSRLQSLAYTKKEKVIYNSVLSLDVITCVLKTCEVPLPTVHQMHAGNFLSYLLTDTTNYTRPTYAPLLFVNLC